MKFADNTVWTAAQVNARALEVFGTAGTDIITGSGSFADVIHGMGGNDTLNANGNNDLIDGGAGNDVLTNTSRYTDNTTYIGGTGNDTITGQYYTNTYIFNEGDGQDTIYEDGPSGNTDVLKFGPGIADDQLWFRQVGNDLEVSVVGAGDSSTIKDWYSGSGYHIEQFKSSNGKTLLDSQVQNLVDAMASFSPPAAGQTTLPANYASALNTVIATNWQ